MSCNRLRLKGQLADPKTTWRLNLESYSKDLDLRSLCSALQIILTWSNNMFAMIEGLHN